MFREEILSFTFVHAYMHDLSVYCAEAERDLFFAVRWAALWLQMEWVVAEGSPLNCDGQKMTALNANQPVAGEYAKCTCSFTGLPYG
jgi:hypothetical protein